MSYLITGSNKPGPKCVNSGHLWQKLTQKGEKMSRTLRLLIDHFTNVPLTLAGFLFKCTMTSPRRLGVQDVLRHLGGFSGAGGALDDADLPTGYVVRSPVSNSHHLSSSAERKAQGSAREGKRRELCEKKPPL